MNAILLIALCLPNQCAGGSCSVSAFRMAPVYVQPAYAFPMSRTDPFFVSQTDLGAQLVRMGPRPIIELEKISGYKDIPVVQKFYWTQYQGMTVQVLGRKLPSGNILWEPDHWINQRVLMVARMR